MPTDTKKKSRQRSRPKRTGSLPAAPSLGALPMKDYRAEKFGNIMDVNKLTMLPMLPEQQDAYGLGYMDQMGVVPPSYGRRAGVGGMSTDPTYSALGHQRIMDTRAADQQAAAWNALQAAADARRRSEFAFEQTGIMPGSQQTALAGQEMQAAVEGRLPVPEPQFALLNQTTQGRNILRNLGVPTQTEVGAKALAQADRSRQQRAQDDRIADRMGADTAGEARRERQAAKKAQHEDKKTIRALVKQGMSVPQAQAVLPGMKKLAAGEPLLPQEEAMLLPGQTAQVLAQERLAKDPQVLRSQALTSIAASMAGSPEGFNPFTFRQLVREYDDAALPGIQSVRGGEGGAAASSLEERNARLQEAQAPGGIIETIGIAPGEPITARAVEKAVGGMLKEGRQVSPGELAKIQELIVDSFGPEEIHGHWLLRGLVNGDITTPEEYQAAQEAYVGRVRDSYRRGSAMYSSVPTMSLE